MESGSHLPEALAGLVSVARQVQVLVLPLVLEQPPPLIQLCTDASTGGGGGGRGFKCATW